MPGKDRLDRAARSALMARIRSTNTAPERIVRSALHRLGYRFRLHGQTLPGHPDIVLTKLRTVIFVHGCFWHQHANCKHATVPRRNRLFWQTKFRHNVARDRRDQRSLRARGWRVFIVWECDVMSRDRLTRRVHRLAAQLRKRPPVDGARAGAGKTRRLAPKRHLRRNCS